MKTLTARLGRKAPVAPAAEAANDPAAPDAAPDATAGTESGAEPEALSERHSATFPAAADSTNLVRRTVLEITALLDEAHHLREELVARGVQTQTINVLVEMGFHGRLDEREQLLGTAVAASEATYGTGAITREGLLTHLRQLDGLEKDLQHSRRLARQQGLDLQVLNFLTQIIRRHPGDGGRQAVNTFFGYALACGIELDGIAEVAQRFGDKPASVLPDIPRRGRVETRWSPAALARDAAIGTVLAAALLAVVS